MNNDKFTFDIAQIKTYIIYNLHKFQNSWLLKITYLKKASSKQPSSLALFIDEKLNINNLKKYLSSNELKYISEISKANDTKKNIFIYEINSKRKIILIKNKKNQNFRYRERLVQNFIK